MDKGKEAARKFSNNIRYGTFNGDTNALPGTIMYMQDETPANTNLIKTRNDSSQMINTWAR